MKTIWKYAIPEESKFSLEIRLGVHGKNAKILDIREQQGIPKMWVLVDPDKKKYVRHFRIFETGEDIPDYMEHIGTFHVGQARLVFHLFETFEEPEDAT